MTTNTSDNLHTIDQVGSFVHGGGVNTFIRSYDDGNTWQALPLLDQVGNPIIGSSIYKTHFFNSSTGVMSGFMITGNSEVIYRTTNGGQNWTMVNMYNGGAWPRAILDMYFTNSSVGYAVGTNNRILKTLNGGNSWSTLSSPVFNSWNGVYFTHSDTGFVCGTGNIIKTVDGGASWTTVYNGTEVLHDIYFPTSNIGYAVGEVVVLKTTDGGDTWNAIQSNLPYSEYFFDVDFISQSTGYVVGDSGVYYTEDGGQFWSYWDAGDQIRAVDHDGINGYIATDSGKAYKSVSNIYPPIASFTPNNVSFCEDSVITFNNMGDPNWNHEWFVNGVSQGSSFNLNYIPTNPSSTYMVELVSENNGLFDTAVYTFNSAISLQFTMNNSVVNDSICLGDIAVFNVANSDYLTDYQIYLNGTPDGTAQSGNGSSIVLNSNPIQGTDTYVIQGVKSVPGCGSLTLVDSITIYNMTPDANLILTPAVDSICAGDSLQVNVLSSEAGVDYHLYINGDSTGQHLVGNNLTLPFNTGGLVDTSFVSIVAEGTTGCIANLNNIATINVQNPTPMFTTNNYYPLIGETIDFLNTNSSIYENYQWDFGGSATPQNATTVDVNGVSFNTAGEVSVKLITESTLGCLDTTQHTIHVLNPVIDSCHHIVLSDSGNQPGLNHINIGNDGSIYCVYNSYNGEHFYSIGQQNDTINSVINFDNINNKCTRLVKYSELGIPQIHMQIIAKNAMATAVTADDSGNIYFAYNLATHLSDPEIVSSDGSRYRYLAALSGSSDILCITKFDRFGMHQWTTNVIEPGISSIEADDNGNIYVSGGYGLYKFNSSGVLLWSDITYSFSDFEIGTDGNIYIAGTHDLIYHKYSPSGQLLYSQPDVTATYGDALIENFNLELDSANNIYIAGRFRNEFIFANDTLDDPYSFGQAHPNVFVAKFDNNGNHKWIHVLDSDAMTWIKGFKVSGSRIGLLTAHHDTVNTDYLGQMPFSTPGILLSTFDTMSLSQGWEKVYQSNSNINGADVQWFAYTQTNQNIFGFNFTGSFNLQSQLVSEYNVSGFESSVLFHGNNACMMSAPPNLQAPAVYFNASSICQNDTLFLNGQGTNAPTSFSWSSTGGTINNTAAQNTFITFSSPGTYTITLDGSNAFGASQSYSQSIYVQPTPTIDLSSFPDSLCIDDGVSLLLPLPSGGTISGNAASGNFFYPGLAVHGVNTVYYTYSASVCTVIDSAEIIVSGVDNIDLSSNPDSLCIGNSAITLSASPLGGFWTGNGVNNDTFDPSIAGAGSHVLDYMIDDFGCVTSDSITVVVDICNSIHEVSPDNFNLSPNPTNDLITIKSALNIEYTWKVYAADGSLVSSSSNKSDTIDLSSAEAGVYLVVINTKDGGRIHSRVVKL